MKSKTLIFGRISITQMIEDQKRLLEYVKRGNIDLSTFCEMYNRATLGLAWEYDEVLNFLIARRMLDNSLLIFVLQGIFRVALRRALKYEAEVYKLPKAIPTGVVSADTV